MQQLKVRTSVKKLQADVCSFTKTVPETKDERHLQNIYFCDI